MILPKSFKLLSIFALLALAPTYGDDVDLEKAINSLVEAERSYAKLALEKDFRAASFRSLLMMPLSLRRVRRAGRNIGKKKRKSRS